MGDSQNPLVNLLPLLVLIALAAMVLLRGSRQRRELEQLQARLAPGMEVMTSSGMFGTVTASDDQVVTLETSPGQTSRWDRRAIARILTDPGAGSEVEDRKDRGPSDPGTAMDPPSTN